MYAHVRDTVDSISSEGYSSTDLITRLAVWKSTRATPRYEVTIARGSQYQLIHSFRFGGRGLHPSQTCNLIHRDRRSGSTQSFLEVFFGNAWLNQSHEYKIV